MTTNAKSRIEFDGWNVDGANCPNCPAISAPAMPLTAAAMVKASTFNCVTFTPEARAAPSLCAVSAQALPTALRFTRPKPTNTTAACASTKRK